MLKIIGGHCIHETPLGVKVIQNALYRWLKLGSSDIQTLLNRRRPERLEMNYIRHLTLSVRRKPHHALLLGLGGGGIAHALAPWMSHYTLDAIEKNAEVIEIARSYFMVNTLPFLSIIFDDAKTYVAHCQKQYEHVMVDLSDAHYFPKSCLNDEFFEHCKRLLTPEGFMAINLAYPIQLQPILKHLREPFKQGIITLPVKGSANIVVLASRAANLYRLMDLVRHERLEKMYWDPMWGSVALLK